jgi:hypothetical protein
MEGKIEKIKFSLFGVFNVIIFLAFFFAKIFNKIDWSWIWVFSPLWIPIAFIGIIISIMCVFYILMLVLELWKK